MVVLVPTSGTWRIQTEDMPCLKCPSASLESNSRPRHGPSAPSFRSVGLVALVVREALLAASHAQFVVVPAATRVPTMMLSRHTSACKEG